MDFHPFDPLQIPSVLVPKHRNFRVASGWSCLCTCLVARRGRTRGFRGSIFASEWWFQACWGDINIAGVVNICQICNKCMGNTWYILHTIHEGIVWEAWEGYLSLAGRWLTDLEIPLQPFVSRAFPGADFWKEIPIISRKKWPDLPYPPWN